MTWGTSLLLRHRVCDCMGLQPLTFSFFGDGAVDPGTLGPGSFSIERQKKAFSTTLATLHTIVCIRALGPAHKLESCC